MSFGQVLLPIVALVLIGAIIAFVVVVGLNATSASSVMSSISPPESENHHTTPTA